MISRRQEFLRRTQKTLYMKETLTPLKLTLFNQRHISVENRIYIIGEGVAIHITNTGHVQNI